MKQKCAGGCGKEEEPNGLNGFLWVTDYDHSERRFLCEECDTPLGYPNGLCHLISKEDYEKVKK